MIIIVIMMIDYEKYINKKGKRGKRKVKESSEQGQFLFPFLKLSSRISSGALRSGNINH